ncbi:MAG: chitobiase/beta-hexosaminidase C-terminal domain-containing protein [Solibacillus sp.]
MRLNKWRKASNIFLATSLVASVAVPVAAETTPVPLASNLLISEYVEGSYGNNKAIEIFNGTGRTIDLSEYTVELYTNKNTTTTVANTLNLTGILTTGDTIVIYHEQADEEIKEKGKIAHGVTNFNGNDTIVLKHNGEVIDSFGKIANDVDFAKDVTYVRNPSNLIGDTNPNDAIDFSGWKNLGKDVFTDLGKHTVGEDDVDEEKEPEVTVPLETVTIAEARELAVGTATQVAGVITAVIGQTIHMQDATAGMVLYGSLEVAVGDEVVVSGSIGGFRNLLQIQNPVLVEKKGTVDVPEPKVVDYATLGEAVEGQLVELNGLTLGDYAGGNYVATDTAGNSIAIRDANNAYGLQTGKTYDSIVGVVQQYNEIYQVIPRSVADIIEDSSAVQPVTASASGLIKAGSTVTLATNTEGATLHYTTDGSEPTIESPIYTGPLTIDADQTIKVFAVKEGFKPSVIAVFDYVVTDGTIKIHHIQGQSHTSPMKGQDVTGVEGVVTYLFKIRTSYYATMQTPDSLVDANPNTSEGILVYIGTSYNGVEVGDHIQVDGKVDEYRVEGNDGDLLSTQINARNGKIITLEKGVALPVVTSVTADTLPRNVIDNDSFDKFDPQEDAIDYWESLEGMRVSFSGLKATAPQQYGDISGVLETRATDTNNGGILITSSDYNADRIHLKAFKENGDAAEDFDVSTGDRFKGEQPIIGVVGYGFSNYKIYVDEADLKNIFIPSNIEPEATTIVKDDSKLTIANYNIENFSANSSATSDAKAKLIAESFVNNMQSPDIIGIVEMQDNNGAIEDGSSAADESYERLIDAIVTAGGPKYAYANIDPVYNKDGGAPGANIRPGFLYNPARVTLKAGTTGDAATAVSYANGELSHNPGLINPTSDAFDSSRKPIAAQFTFNGEDVLVIANHFNSKGGDTALFGATQPPVLSSEVQRNKIAGEVKSFVEAVKADNEQANLVVLGDFNDFEFAQPLTILESAGLANMIKELPRADRYTYTYQGNSQVLDHILVSEHLKAGTKVDALHINADYSGVSGKRASDHDPVLVQIDLTHKETPIVAGKNVTLNNIKTKDILISSPSINVHISNAITYETLTITSAEYASVTGALNESIPVIVRPAQPGAILDFNGITLQKLVIDGPNVKELRGVSNVKEIQYINGATAESITIK